MSTIQVKGVLELDGSGWDKTLAKAEEGVKSLAEEALPALKAAIGGAFAAYAVEKIREFGTELMEFAHQMEVANERTGISTDDLQKFQFAAERAGTSLEAVTGAIEKLGISQAKAANDKTIFDALTRLGLTPEQIANLDAGAENFKLIAERVREAGFSGQMLKDMVEVMGKNSKELIPLMKNGLKENGDELERIGGLIQENDLKALAQSSEDMKEAWVAMRGAVEPFFGVVAKWFTFQFGELRKMEILLLQLKDVAFQFAGMSGVNNAIDAMAGLSGEGESKTPVDYQREKSKAGDREEKEASKESARAEESDYKKYDELVARLAEVRRKADLEELDRAQKLLLLTKERAALEAKIAGEKLTGNPRYDPMILKDMIRAEELRGQIGELQRQGSGSMRHEGRTDSLVRVGNFLGGSRNSIESIGQRTNQILTQIHSALVNPPARHYTEGPVPSH